MTRRHRVRISDRVHGAVRCCRTTALAVALASSTAAAENFGVGRAPTPAELRAWDIDVRGDGAGLPPGQGGVAHGRTIFMAKCAACHGPKGEGGIGPPLAGGIGSLATSDPIKTVGSYWPYAPPVFDYVRRAMPYNAPQSLSVDETYAATAYILHLNGLVATDAVMNRETLPKVVMPNRHGFTGDPRPDVGRAAAEPVRKSADTH